MKSILRLLALAGATVFGVASFLQIAVLTKIYIEVYRLPPPPIPYTFVSSVPDLQSESRFERHSPNCLRVHMLSDSVLKAPATRQEGCEGFIRGIIPNIGKGGKQ